MATNIPARITGTPAQHPALAENLAWLADCQPARLAQPPGLYKRDLPGKTGDHK